LADQLLKDFEFSIKSLTIIPSDGGRFEVSIDGELVYSKLQTGRHAEYAEIKRAVEARLKRR
jgi:selenoprotein W-related protein